MKVDFNLGCRGKGCKKIHNFNHIPTKDFKCSCGYQLIKDETIYPSRKKDGKK